jgi:hypothetical protein
MLLNNDIQLFFCSNDFTLSKEINVIMYIIEFYFFESFHLNKILIKYENLKIYVFVMFKMKYLINRM